MSHIRPEGKAQKHRRSDCRKGRHEYGGAQNVGAGIRRQVCIECGAVTIDLTGTDELTTPMVSPNTNILAWTAKQTGTSKPEPF
jgi:hypothetical protein